MPRGRMLVEPINVAFTMPRRFCWSLRRAALELLDDVLEGRINPGSLFDCSTDLDAIVEAYTAMDERRAVKSLLRIGTTH
jgi:threonine dehydrogenase-like Zn-dependent dehydrogenase